MDNQPYSIERLFRIFINPQTYLNLIYLFLSFPLGLTYFIILITGLSLGFGLLIIWVGLLILTAVLAISWACVHFERLLAIHLLKVNLPQPETVSIPSETIFHRVRRYLGNPLTWKGLAYLFLKFPLGTATFVIAVTLLSLSLSFVFAPFIYPFWHLDFFFFRIDSFPVALVAMVVGVFLTPLSLYFLNFVADGWAKFTTAMLQPVVRPPLVPIPANQSIS
jgi:hypothetical protein